MNSVVAVAARGGSRTVLQTPIYACSVTYGCSLSAYELQSRAA
jgi:hypothetical protein